MISPIFEIRTARAMRGEGGGCRCPLVVASVAHGALERRSWARRQDDWVLVCMSPTESHNHSLGPNSNLGGGTRGQGGGEVEPEPGVSGVLPIHVKSVELLTMAAHIATFT